jgi:methionyl-tRNA formyltransferase
MINVHASLLPRWRGAAPVHRAILAGDVTTGVTIMRVVPRLDAGPMLDRRQVSILPDETSAELERRLADLGATLLVEVVDRLEAGPAREEAQDEAAVSYAPRLDRRERALDWNQSAARVHDHIRGLQPWPLAAVVLNGHRLRLHRSAPAPDWRHDAAPGTVLEVESDAVVVATAPGAVRLLAVQPEGRSVMPARAFLAGHAVGAGDRCFPATA